MVGVRTEGQAPDVRVEAVGADDEVEAARRGVAEGDVHAGGRLGEGGDGVPEDVLGPGGERGPVEDPGEVAAQYLDVAAGELGGEAQELAAVGVDEGHRAATGPKVVQLVEDPHPPKDAELGLPSEVDGLAARTQGGGDLDDGGTHAVAGESEGQGGARDAGARDEDGRGPGARLVGVCCRCGHRGSPCRT